MTIRDEILALQDVGNLSGVRDRKNQAHADSVPSVPFSWVDNGTFYTVTRFESYPADGAPWVWLDVTRAGQPVPTDPGGYVFHNPPIMVPVQTGGVLMRPARTVGNRTYSERRGREDPFGALKIIIQDVIG